VATSWDNQVRCWDVQPSGQAIPKAAASLEKPLLCSAWRPDGGAVFVGGCDHGVKLWDLATNQQQQVAQHAAPVRHCCYIPAIQLLVTGSWDKTLKYWDTRSPTAAHTQTLTERVYALDVSHPLLVVGTADRNIQVFNLQNPSQAYKQLASPLKYQTRAISAFPDATGYLVGSVEGRVAVHHVEDSLQAKNFTFKCHRDGNDVFAVNSMAFHPGFGTFVTAGSDGAYNFWDKDSKQRLKAMAKCGQPITAGAFSRDGAVYAYACSYDWSRGAAEYNPATAKNSIMLHSPTEAEVKGRQRVPGRR
jgi:mRNA export factor